MLIMVDTNEQSTNKSVVDQMQIHFPSLIISQLAFGDVNVILEDGSTLAIERKEISDFLGSIADGRVFRQVEAMAAGAKFYCVIIIGSIGFDENDMVHINNKSTNWRGKSVRGALHALQWSGCPVMWTKEKNFPFAVMEAIEFCSKPVEHTQLKHQRIVTFPPLEPEIEILASFPNVGVKRAQSLMDFVQQSDYSTLAGALAWASAFPLIPESNRPEGWGVKSINNFRTLLGLKDNEYLEIRKEGEK